MQILSIKPAILAIALALCASASYAAAPDFSALKSSDEQSFLPAAQAFKSTVDYSAENALAVKFSIAPGYYLYQNKFKITSSNPLVKVGTITYDQKAHSKDDPNFGLVNVFTKQVGISAPISGPSGSYDVLMEYQGCAEAGLCYPPVKQTLSVELTSPDSMPAMEEPAPVKKPDSTAANEQPVSSSGANTAVPAAAADNALFANKSLALTLLTLFALGVGLAFTPCVFPMMPILSSIIAGNNALTPMRGFALSMAYVQGMAVVYATLGLLMGLFGAKANLQLWLQNPWVIAGSAVLFVILALGMFGVYTLQLPQRLQNRLNSLSGQQHGGSLTGVFAMGALSALVVSPCVSAPLVGVLSYIASTGNALTGGLSLYALALGMGIPLLVIGTLGGKYLPRAGGWMDAVKFVFGISLLGVAIWMLSRIIPASITMALWAILASVTAIFMGALQVRGTSPAHKVAQALGLLLLVWAAMLLVGTFSKATSALAPLAGLHSASAGTITTTPTNHVEFNSVTSIAELQQLMADATAQNKPFIVNLSAKWCTACQVMHNTTFKDASVTAAFAPYTLIRLDITDSDDTHAAWLQQRQLFGPPALLFYNAAGSEVQRIVGEASAAHVLSEMPKL